MGAKPGLYDTEATLKLVLRSEKLNVSLAKHMTLAHKDDAKD